MNDYKKNNLLTGAIFALLSAIAIGLLLFSYIIGAGDSSFMDFVGWIYFFLSSLMHAGIIVMIPFILLFVPFALLGVNPKVNASVLGILYVVIAFILVINRFVFQIYHFHINGFVLDMLFSKGAKDIFVLSFWMYLLIALIFISVCFIIYLLYRLALFLGRKNIRHRRFYSCSLLSFLTVMILSQGLHVYGAATLRVSILESDSFIPYYFPISMNSLLDKWGIIDQEEIPIVNIKDNWSKIAYPTTALRSDNSSQEHPNIILIVIDSWNFATLTPECMPNLWKFKEESEYYANHLSSSNGTSGGIFGLFTGIPSYYWKSFEYSNIKPVLIEQMQNNNYSIQIYPSATFQNPPFDRMFFKGMDDIYTSTEGESPYERDCNLTQNFLNELPDQLQNQNPFFSFLFYDLAHAMYLPLDKNIHFQPAWEFPNYSILNNNLDPLPFFNLYKNCIYQVDSLIGLVIDNLREHDLLTNTVVIITGDHGQEFNENKKNYWGHSGNYTKYQIQVPLILHYPSVKGKKLTYRTTHYDIVPTLLSFALGVANPPSDYSMGQYLQDSTSRGWHIVGIGNDLNYAFITEDGYIIEKEGGGYIKVYDKNLNLQKNYELSPQLINENLLKLNRFYK